MLKINTLRAALVAAIPDLARNPKNLRIWVDRGSGRATQTATRSFSFVFRLNVLLLDFTYDIAALALAVLEWARTHQVDLLDGKNDAFAFDVDFLDDSSADILLQLNLSQAVGATQTEQGFTLEYLPEPAPFFIDDLAPPPLAAAPVPLLSAIRIAGEGQIAPLPE